LLADADADGMDADAEDIEVPNLRRCRLPSFVKLQQRIVRHARPSSSRSTPRFALSSKMAFGCHSVDAIAALAMLSLGGHRPALPAR
jgi:transposase